jgi:hypothetical protein
MLKVAKPQSLVFAVCLPGVLQAYRMAVLMRKLDSMRLQPPPSCAAGSPHKQQLSQVDVMHAVNGVLFAGRASAV